MPELEIFRLAFRTGLHVGEHGIGQEETLAYLPSDTLFAALAATRAHMGAEVSDWIEQFKSQPPFRLTSAFPYAGKVRFYPRPLTLRNQDLERGKPWKRVAFVSEGLLQAWQSGKALDLPKPEQRVAKDAVQLQGGALWLLRDEFDRLPETMRTHKNKAGKMVPLPLKSLARQKVWQENAVPRVLVDRVSSASDIFHTGRIVFAPECGLWFGVTWSDETARLEFINTLRVLGDTGIGAERSVGYGAFALATDGKQKWDEPNSNELTLLLSRFYPQPKEASDVLAVAKSSSENIRGQVARGVTGFSST
jgi:CRISPR-associated protein Csm4